MAKRERSPGPRLFMVLGLGVASFVLATIVAERTGSSTETRTRLITLQAMPSVEHLATLRTELLHAQILAGDLATKPGAADPIRRELDHVRATLELERKSYQSLPRFPGEVALSDRLSVQLEDVRQSLEALQAEPSPDRVVAINLQQVHPAVDRASNLAQSLTDFNAQAADDEAKAIEATRLQVDQLLLGLDLLCAALCGLGAFLAWRTVQLYLGALQIQRRLLEARATELEAFSGRVAHDILSPLGAASLAISMMERIGPSPKMLERAKGALARAASIVDGLLSFARAGARPEPGASCELGRVFTDAIGALQERAVADGIALVFDGEADVAVACHPGVLTSLVTNLVGNAIKYMGPAADRRIAIHVVHRRGWVRIEVHDTGPGIPPDLQARVFEPYVRANHHHEPGIGLGLATVKKLCLAHGGTVGLRSEVGKGSTFWFELPSLWERAAEPSGELSTAH